MSRPHIPSVPQVMQPFNLKVCKRQVSVQTTQCRTCRPIIRVITTNLTHTMNEYFNLKDSKLQLADYFIMIHFISAERVSQSFHRKSFNLTFTDPTSAPYVSNNSPSFKTFFLVQLLSFLSPGCCYLYITSLPLFQPCLLDDLGFLIMRKISKNPRHELGRYRLISRAGKHRFIQRPSSTPAQVPQPPDAQDLVLRSLIRCKKQVSSSLGLGFYCSNLFL